MSGYEGALLVRQTLVAGAERPAPVVWQHTLGNRSQGPRRSFSSSSRRYVLILAALDAIIGALAVAVPSQFSDNLNAAPELVVLPVLFALAIWPLTIGLSRGYNGRQIGVGTEEIRPVLRAGVALIVIGAFPAGLLSELTWLKLVVVAVPVAVGLSLIARYVARKILHRRQRAGLNVREVVIVGGLASTIDLSSRLERESHCGMRVIGACVPAGEVEAAKALGLTVLGDLSDVAGVIRRVGADAVAVTSDDATRNNFLRYLSWSLEGAGVEMLVDPGLVEVAGPRMHIRPMMGFPLLQIEEPHFAGWRKALKRIFDVALTGLGIVVIAPLLAAIALVIKIQDGGPVFFKQRRVGRGGQEFTMYKFRSMVIDAEARKADLLALNEGKGGLFKLTRDPRITPLGRFLRDYSLDELPQLFNVLNGTMSLVGPRPHLAHELAEMPSEASRRALVTPGLTGLWQVSGRSHLEGDDAIRLDLRYVENWSFTLDLLIMWKTASAVLAKRGAS